MRWMKGLSLQRDAAVFAVGLLCGAACETSEEPAKPIATKAQAVSTASPGASPVIAPSIVEPHMYDEDANRRPGSQVVERRFHHESDLRNAGLSSSNGDGERKAQNSESPTRPRSTASAAHAAEPWVIAAQERYRREAEKWKEQNGHLSADERDAALRRLKNEIFAQARGVK